MAGCLSCGERGNVSPENVRRWTDNLSNVLLSSTARNKFKSYLIDRELEEGQFLVEFWEECGRFLTKVDEGHRHTQGCRRENSEQDACCTKTGATDWDNKRAKLLLEEAEKIVQFAEEKIDFDAQMISLKDAFHSRDTKQMVTAISEAKQSAAEMLEYKGYYKLFCQYLLQEKGLLRKGD